MIFLKSSTGTGSSKYFNKEILFSHFTWTVSTVKVKNFENNKNRHKKLTDLYYMYQDIRYIAPKRV